MQENTRTRKSIDELSLEDKQKLVGAFVWIIQEDKKQHPELYQLKRVKNDD